MTNFLLLVIIWLLLAVICLLFLIIAQVIYKEQEKSRKDLQKMATGLGSILIWTVIIYLGYRIWIYFSDMSTRAGILAVASYVGGWVLLAIVGLIHSVLGIKQRRAEEEARAIQAGEDGYDEYYVPKYDWAVGKSKWAIFFNMLRKER